MKHPKGFYIYAYIDPHNNEPFYIGKGRGDRAYRHLDPSWHSAQDSPFYRKLYKMLENQHPPGILIIKDGLTEEDAYESETALIQLVGKQRDGTGPLCNVYTTNRPFSVTLWGIHFHSVSALSRDPRCVIVLDTLRSRLYSGWDVERAVTMPSNCGNPAGGIATVPSNSSKQIGAKQNCWGKVFPSLIAVARDPRCAVGYQQLRIRLKAGWDIERAVSESTPTPVIKFT
jgi:hypothetical protein